MTDVVGGQSQTSVYRVLKAGRPAGSAAVRAPRKKGHGLRAAADGRIEHWHVDISYINRGRHVLLPLFAAGRIQPLYRALGAAGNDEGSRRWRRSCSVVAREVPRRAKPRIISDNGPQFVARDFKEFVRLMGMAHVRTSPYYPQSQREVGAVAPIAQAGMHPACMSGQRRRRRGGRWGRSSSAITTSGCTRRWAMSRRPTS